MYGGLTTYYENELRHKFKTTYRSENPRFIDPAVLDSMTPLEAIALISLESQDLYDGGSGGGPVYERAWQILSDLVDNLEK